MMMMAQWTPGQFLPHPPEGFGEVAVSEETYYRRIYFIDNRQAHLAALSAEELGKQIAVLWARWFKVGGQYAHKELARVNPVTLVQALHSVGYPVYEGYATASPEATREAIRIGANIRRYPPWLAADVRSVEEVAGV